MEDKKDGLKKDFKEADKGFSKVELKKKVFMKLSDIDPEDAKWFKDFCDEHTDRKQFLGIKYMRLAIERGNILPLIDQLHKRIDVLETMIASLGVGEEEPEGIQIPRTQGSALKNGN